MRALHWSLLIGITLAAGLGYWSQTRGVGVEVSLVAPQDLHQSVVLSGRISSGARTEVSSQTTARIEKVLVSEGDRVQPGQLLLQLRDEEAQAALRQSQAQVKEALAALARLDTIQSTVALQSVAQTQANLQQAEAELARVQDLQRQGFVSASRVEDAQRVARTAKAALLSAQAQAGGNRADGAERAIAMARLEQAQASQRAARSRQEQLALRAVSAGVVIQRTVDPGDTAQPGRTLLVISDTAQTRIEASVDEKNLRHLQLGQQATASADAYPDQRFAARLDYVAPAIDAQRGTVDIRLEVAQPVPSYLRSDMTVSVEIVTATAAGALAVPPDAIRRDAKGAPSVLVLREGTAQQVEVQTGLATMAWVQIRQGLRAGEQVIVPGNIAEPGQRVREQSQRAPRANVPSMPGFTS